MAGLEFWQRFEGRPLQKWRIVDGVGVLEGLRGEDWLLQGIFSFSGDKRCCVRREGRVESTTSFFIETLSDEVGFGETGEISIVDITEKFDGDGKSRELRAQMGSWPAWTKRLEIGIARERTTEPQVEHQSERRTMGHVQAATEKKDIATHGYLEEMFRGKTQAASNTRQRAKVRARVPLLLDVDHQRETVNMVQALKKKNAEGNPVHLVTRSSRRGIST